MVKFIDIVYGLSLYFVLFSVIILIGGQKFNDRFNTFGTPYPVIFAYGGLYVWGAVCTGIVIETARTSGMWYSTYCMVISVIFKTYFTTVLLLEIIAREKLSRYTAYIAGRFRVNAFMRISALTGFGCLAAYIMIHSIHLYIMIRSIHLFI